MKVFAIFFLLLALLYCSMGASFPIFPPLLDANNGTAAQPIVNYANITGDILPTEVFYYKVNLDTDSNNGEPFDYLVIQYWDSPQFANDGGKIFVAHAPVDDLESALNDDQCENVKYLPSPFNYQAECGLNGLWSSVNVTGGNVTHYCNIQITCPFLTNETYYIAVAGGELGAVYYRFTVYRGTRNATELTPDGTPILRFDTQRPTVVGDNETQINQEPNWYEYYEIDIPDYTEGQYLIVNISRVEPFYDGYPILRLHYEELPVAGDAVNQPCEYQYCVDRFAHPIPYYVHPTAKDPLIPCECQPFVQSFGNGNIFQATCNVTVSPCHMKTGKWYASVSLPPRARPQDSVDYSGLLNYTITAYLVQPTVVELERDQIVKAYVVPSQAAHFKIEISDGDVEVGKDHLIVHIDGIRGATLDVWVHQGLGEQNDLAGGPETCVVANATCRTCDVCNLVIEKCYFVPGTWYVSVNIPYVDGRFLVEDINRLPASFTLEASWEGDASVVSLLAGVPVQGSIAEGLYDFYVLDVPPTVDTQLYIELFVNANATEVIVSVLHGEIPGGECYGNPDFYCLTGDPRGPLPVTTGPPQFLKNVPVARESCTFMIEQCNLEAGPLYISVYGHRLDYIYGDKTFYGIPVEYTLYTEFRVPNLLVSGLAYSEHVYWKQYNHYYIRADEVAQGSWMTVEVTNIEHGIPPTVETFVNYNFLAGMCPCFDSLYNCTGNFRPPLGQASPYSIYGVVNNPGQITDPDDGFTPELDIVNHCCTIIVPPCDFRPGVWYIGVLGVNENLYEYVTPIGYTLTVTINDPPPVTGLVLGQPTAGVAPQWNKTLEYSHFKIGALPIPGNYLVIRLTYIQSAEFLGKHDNTRDRLRLYVNKNNVAGEGCYYFTCEANIYDSSYCDVIVPECLWTQSDQELLPADYQGSGQADYLYVAVQGNYDATFEARFTVVAHVVPVVDVELQDGVPVKGVVPNQQYVHYFYSATPDSGRNQLNIDFYTNSDQNRVTVYLNIDTRAGDAPCYSYKPGYVCTDVSCSWQIPGYSIVEGKYYISVFGGTYFDNSQFAAIPVEFTLTVTEVRIVTSLPPIIPYVGNVLVNQINHYAFVTGKTEDGDYLLFKVSNVKHGHVRAFARFPNEDDDDQATPTLAGPLPYNRFDITCDARGSECGDAVPYNDPDSCVIRINPCDLEQETAYFYSIYGVSYNDADRSLQSPNVFTTPIGYTVQATIVRPTFVSPAVNRGRDPDNKLTGQSVATDHFIHYAFTTDNDDIGYQVVVEIDGIHDGDLYVYYSNEQVADSDTNCQQARICTSEGALSPGDNCNWQVPYCLASGDDNRDLVHYVTVQGAGIRGPTRFNILIWKNAPLSVPQNPNFNPLNLTGTADDSLSVNVVHYFDNQPNGWVQFIQLPEVVILDREFAGDILEVFFYNVENNLGESIAFDAYLWPGQPAGATRCCPGSPPSPEVEGSCQGLPCLHHVPTTTSTDNFADARYSSTCYAGQTGTGANPSAQFPGPLACALTVWSCDLEHFQPQEQPTNWWLTVVPRTGLVQNQPPVVSLPGLSYTVAWKVRNVRNVGDTPYLSESLDSYINQGFTGIFSVQGFQNWASFTFSVDIEDEDEFRTKIIVQTAFVNGKPGSVYVLEGKNANPLNCNQYYCPGVGLSDTVCATTERYLNSSCCAATGQYFISVRNQDISNSNTPVQFRLRITTLTENTGLVGSNAVVIKSSKALTSSNIWTSPAGAYVEGENYDHYQLNIQESDFSDGQSLNILLQRLPASGSGDLQLFFRKGTQAGNFDYGLGDEGCYSYQYSCTTTDSVYQCCSLQIPHCQLEEGAWFIGVYNPNFDYSFITNITYRVEVYFDDPPIPLSLGVTYNNTVGHQNPNVTNITVSCSKFYTHHILNLTVDDIQYDRSILNGYYTEYLRIQVVGYNGSSLDLYVNYGDVAGSSSDYYCLDYFSRRLNCQNVGTNLCYVDILPCSDPFDENSNPKLLSGPYYVSLKFAEGDLNTTYSILATIQVQNFTQLTPTVFDHWRGGKGQNAIYTASVDNVTAVLPAYYYAFDITNDQDEDDLAGDTYMIGQLTVTSGGVAPAVTLNVWRDDCTRWTCSVNSVNGTCYIDALELAPCSVRGGRYYIEVLNPNLVNFTIFWFYNSTYNTDLCSSGDIYVSDVYSFEYQELKYKPGDRNGPTTLALNIVSSTASIEAWIQPLTFAGPGPQANNVDTSCNIDYCRTVPDGKVSLFGLPSYSCQLFLDTCNFADVEYYVAIRGDVQSFAPAAPGQLVTNLTNIAIPYTISPIETGIELLEFTTKHCYETVVYDQPANVQPFQYTLEVDTLLAGGQIRFTLAIPVQAYNVNKVATLTVTRNYTVQYTDQCDNYETYECTVPTFVITPLPRTCTILLDECVARAGKYYIWADAPRGTEILVEKYEQPIHGLPLSVVVHSSVPAVVPLVGFELQPWQTNYLVYRVNIDPLNRKFYFRAILSGLQNDDQATLYVNDGQFPTANGGCANVWSCPNFATKDQDCVVRIARCDLPQNILPIDAETCQQQVTTCDDNCAFKCGQQPPTYLFLTVEGIQQTSPLQSVAFDLFVQDSVYLDQILLINGNRYCSAVPVNDYHFYKTSRGDTPLPQEKILQLEIDSVAIPNAVDLLVQDGFVPSSGPTGTLYPYQPKCNLQESLTVATADPAYGSTSFEWICATGSTRNNKEFPDNGDIDDDGFEVAIFGALGANGAKAIQYCVDIKYIDVLVTPLVEGLRYRVNDPCTHARDFYLFNTTGLTKEDSDAFFSVSVRSPQSFTVYLNRGSFAWKQCTNTDYGSVIDDPQDDDEANELVLHDFCHYNNGNLYYITVTANTNYSIKASVQEDTQFVGVGSSLVDVVSPGEYRTYRLNVKEKDFSERSRLVVAIEDVYFGSVEAYIRKSHIGGPFTLVGDTAPRTCTIQQYADTGFGIDEPTYSVVAVFPPDGQSSGYANLIVDSCCLEPGDYYVTVYGLRADATSTYRSAKNCRAARFTISPKIITVDVEPSVEDLDSGNAASDVVDYYNVARASQYSDFPRYRYYKYTGQGFDNGFAQVRLANVQNGYLTLYAKVNHFACFSYAVWNNDIEGLNNGFGQDILSGSRPFQVQPFDFLHQNGLNGGCSDYVCSTGASDDEPYRYNSSCAIWIDQCSWDSSGVAYFAVEPDYQFYEDTPIQYDIQVDEYEGFISLNSGKTKSDSFTDNNWEYSFYAFSQQSPEAATVHVVVSSGVGVLVDLYSGHCPSCVHYHKQIWCDAKFSDDEWLCEIEIPQRSEHPGDDVLNFYISVYGKDAKYSISYIGGTDNCEQPSDLDFCAGLPYNTWKWNNYKILDNQARCLFDELYAQFRVQPCWLGVTPECNDTLIRFSCYETFRSCDSSGFQVGTCRGACESVVYQCVNYFDSVGLLGYNCTSGRYVDNTKTCTGSSEQAYPLQGVGLGDVDNILFKSTLTSVGASTSLAPSFFVMLLIAVLVFVGTIFNSSFL